MPDSTKGKDRETWLRSALSPHANPLPRRPVRSPSRSVGHAARSELGLGALRERDVHRRRVVAATHSLAPSVRANRRAISDWLVHSALRFVD